MKKLITTLITVALLATTSITFGRTTAELREVIKTTTQELTVANDGRTNVHSWDAESKDMLATLYEEKFDVAVAEANLDSMLHSMTRVTDLDKTRGRVLFDQIDRAMVFTPNVAHSRVWFYYNRMLTFNQSPLTTTEAQYVYDNKIMVHKVLLFKAAIKVLNIPASEVLLSFGNITLWKEDPHQVLFNEAMNTLVNGEWRDFCSTLFERILPLEENLEIKTLLKRIKEGQ